MIRPLSTLVLCGVLGSMVLVGNAQACHKPKCGHARVVCAAPVPVTYVARAPKVKRCSFKLPTFCHKKAVTTVACVTYSAPAPVYYSTPVSYPVASPQSSPQTSAQH